MTSLASLPTEILIKSLINLELPDILRICSTNHQINSICNDEYFWLEKLRKDFPLAIKDKNTSSKDFYQKVYQTYQNNIFPYLHNCEYIMDLIKSSFDENQNNKAWRLTSPYIPFDAEVKNIINEKRKGINYYIIPDIYYPI